MFKKKIFFLFSTTGKVRGLEQIDGKEKEEKIWRKKRKDVAISTRFCCFVPSRLILLETLLPLSLLASLHYPIPTSTFSSLPLPLHHPRPSTTSFVLSPQPPTLAYAFGIVASPTTKPQRAFLFGKSLAVCWPPAEAYFPAIRILFYKLIDRWFANAIQDLPISYKLFYVPPKCRFLAAGSANSNPKVGEGWKRSIGQVPRRTGVNKRGWFKILVLEFRRQLRCTRVPFFSFFFLHACVAEEGELLGRGDFNLLPLICLFLFLFLTSLFYPFIQTILLFFFVLPPFEKKEKKKQAWHLPISNDKSFGYPLLSKDFHQQTFVHPKLHHHPFQQNAYG